MQPVEYYLGCAPDGRELFRYRIPIDRYEQLRTDLRARLRWGLAGPPRDVCSLFCIFAAEWWRREHERGPWSWDGIKDALGVGTAPYSQLADVVDRGLRALGRPLLRSADDRRSRLVTVACEAGLPLRRLSVEGARLALFFRDILEHLQALGMNGAEEIEHLAEIAAESDHRLPVSLRREVVHRLAGELVGRAWSLRQAIPEDARDPIAILDEADHDWRSRLPLLIDDEVAQSLLQGLLRDVSQVAAGRARSLRVVSRMRLSSGGAMLSRALDGPSSVDDEELSAIFGEQPLPAGNRLQLRLRTESGDATRVGVLVRSGAQGWAFQPSATATLNGAGATGLVGMVAASRRGGSVEAVFLEGASQLGPLPWVFRAQDERGKEWELIATGSCRRRDGTLLVAVPPESEVEGDFEDVGVPLLDRRLVRTSAELRVRTGDGVVRVRASHDQNDANLFELRGQRLSGLSTSRTAWLGLPSLVRRSGGRPVEVDFEVKAAGDWRRPTGEVLGDVDVRAVRDGEVLYRERIRVVPADLRLELRVGDRSRPGRVVIESSLLVRAGVPSDPRWVSEVNQGPGRTEIDLRPTGDVPGQLPVQLLFRGGALEGALPFPVRGLRFEGPDGNTIDPDSGLHIKRLGGIRALALSPEPDARFAVSLKPMGVELDEAPTERTFFLAREKSGEHVLDLRDVQTSALEILDGTERLDAAVRIELWELGGTGRPIRISARRYDWTLERDEETGDVVLQGPTPEEAAGVVVEARQFVDVGTPVPLRRLHSARFPEPRWVFDPDSREGTTWLVTARDEGWYRCRPVPFWGRGATPPLEGLRAAFEIGEQSERDAALHACLGTMDDDWDHPDWTVVDAYLHLLGDLPASSFDLVRTIAHRPVTSAMVALRVAGWAPADALQVLDGFEELLFLWEGLPLKSWHQALDRLLAAFPEDMAEFALQEVQSRAALLSSELPHFSVVVDGWARHRSIPLTQAANRAVPLPLTHSPVHQTWWLGLRDQARMEMLRRQAVDQRWPMPRSWRAVEVEADLQVSVPSDDRHRRLVFDAPVLLAQAAAGVSELSPISTLFLKDVRAFDPAYFSECFRFTFCALAARASGA